MSRFSKAEAEARGWAFVHAQEEMTEYLGDGVHRVKPASYRAEKRVGSSLVSEEGETIGLLLERVHAYEQHLDKLPAAQTVEPDGHDMAPGRPIEDEEPAEGLEYIVTDADGNPIEPLEDDGEGLVCSECECDFEEEDPCDECMESLAPEVAEALGFEA